MRFLLFLIVAGAFMTAPAFAQEPYQGPVYDAHAHLSKRVSPAKVLDHIIKPGFGKAAIFVDVERIDEVATFASDKLFVFVDPFKRKKIKLGGGKKEVRYEFSKRRFAAIEAALEKGRVSGFGEIYFRLGYAPFAEQGIHTPITDSGAKALFEVAKAHNVPVQIHLDADFADELEQLLRDNSAVTIILSHCGYLEPERLSALMDRHANLHAETSLVFNPDIPKFANLPLEGGALRPDWEALLTRHGARIMVGTDYSDFRAEQVPKLLAYYRQVLGHLPPEVAENIAYKNFERLFTR